ncbi:hypothetical protein DFJ63DRAFT_336044 [Scheffersomyces coipomensis]|uniref:uncharacterized protein n=1 Tax=Scheffersomyces coipomensis TaxID=1788519 RepID=UPI00315C918A
MSAYAALKDNSSISSIFHESADGEDDAIIGYQQNSSDEDEDVIINYEEPSISTNTATPQPPSNSPISQVVSSRFSPNNDNIILKENYIIIGLKVHEYLVINGQFKLNIQRGAILMNNFHYLHARRNHDYTISAPSSHSLPIIASTQVLDRSKIEDNIYDENAHLFSSDYKSVIKLSSFYTGLESIGKYYSPFKRLFFDPYNDDIVINSYDKIFTNYSFEILFQDKRMIGLNIDKSWAESIESIQDEIKDDYTPKLFMAIGTKNSGKSTLNKTLINALLTEGIASTTISYLDLDPGQPEISKPYSLSLSRISNPNFGMSIPSITHTESSIEQYFGYTSPVHRPTQYISIIRSLFNHYKSNNKQMGDHLIINTPGWIKGYGREILTELTSFINPDYLIVLSNSLDDTNKDNVDLIKDLTFKKSKFMQGVYQASKYLPAQLRTLNKLVYFHQSATLEFNFNHHILNNSPFKLSYETSSSPDSFVGVNAVSILNFDVSNDFNYEDLPLMLESSIMGIYAIDHEYFYASSKLFHKSPSQDNLPVYLSSSNFDQLASYNDVQKFKYMGLTMIHSINRLENFFNVYLPETLMTDLKELLLQGIKLVLVRGEGELASPEILNPALILKKGKELKRLKSNKLKGNSPVVESTLTVPHVSFESKSKVGGVWRVRRNVQRRSQKR